ncbi:MAG: TRAP transporter small permease [Hydrogenophaga sp.]|jgi:TRAP-type C4-dicarboxylate transport system permease small subunit|uniref:TRAP transporter small permease n=1 Tax=Hydrogenophaga sp. TaxID=1904254 RepID=UPI002718B7D4|nr:TRAP transporter small permease [Hydrogenophaga sp.]MDO9571675.1 TRAP transporter small permease [Hydrogenophaga sp.]MDP2092806.1 TRAP transporter small permease [Hydrogenophaga sp.]MDP2219584.1 TRAP transporter small permease [Hydrogenophaga sp.]MDP3374577.1 TRAP transporter small permease [Hydrogenophaga sp.]
MFKVDATARMERAASWLAQMAVMGLLLLAAITTVDVLMRYAFAKPLQGYVDVAALAAAVLLAACIPHVLVSRGNIAVNAVGALLGARVHRVLDRFAAVVTATFVGVLAWQYIYFTIDLKNTSQVMPVLRWVVWPWWAAVGVFVGFAALAAFVTAWNTSEGDRHG